MYRRILKNIHLNIYHIKNNKINCLFIYKCSLFYFIREYKFCIFFFDYIFYKLVAKLYNNLIIVSYHMKYLTILHNILLFFELKNSIISPDPLLIQQVVKYTEKHVLFTTIPHDTYINENIYLLHWQYIYNKEILLQPYKNDLIQQIIFFLKYGGFPPKAVNLSVTSQLWYVVSNMYIDWLGL